MIRVYRKVCKVCGKISDHKSSTSYTCNNCLEKGVKYCGRCTKVLPLSTFNNRGYCKECGITMSCNINNARYANDKEFRQYFNTYCKDRYKNDKEFKDKRNHYSKLNDYKRRGAVGKHTEEEWQECLKFFSNKCVYCGTTKNLSRDHVVAIVKGGTNNIDNIVPACRSCNSRKQDKDLEAFTTNTKEVEAWRVYIKQEVLKK